jgi:ABC-type amino acid transport substrate-binding protein
MFKKTFFFLIGLLILSSCSENEIEKNEIRCIVTGKIPPFTYYENYDLVGFEIDLVKKISEKIGKKIVFDNLAGSQVIANLERGYADIAVGSFVMSKERQRNFFMTQYHTENASILINNSLKKYNSLREFKNMNKGEISSIYGMFSKDFIEWFKENFPNDVKITYFFNEILTIYALNNGIVSGVIMSESEANFLKSSDSSRYDYFKLDDLVFNFGILIQKNNKKLYLKIMNAINDLEKSGEIEQIRKKYEIKNLN